MPPGAPRAVPTTAGPPPGAGPAVAADDDEPATGPYQRGEVPPPVAREVVPTATAVTSVGQDGGVPDVEVPLLGGDVTEGLVRVGDTVRRPRQEQSDFVAAYLRHLELAGFDGAPRWHGVDERGRDVLDFLPGEVPGDPPEPWSATDGALVALAGLLRRLHAASEGYRPDPALDWFGRRALVDLPPGLEFPPPDLVSHMDVTPQNVVFRGGLPVALIDFDLARPAPRILELLNTAMWWVPLQHPDDRPPAQAELDVPARLRLFLDAYGLARADRVAMLDLADRAWKRSWLLMRHNATARGGGWARMWAEGAGDRIARRRLWLRFERENLDAALG